MGVIPLKPMPASVHHRCHPRLLKNSLRPGLSGLKRLTVDQCGWSDALKKALEGTQLDLEDITLDEIVPGCPDNRVECVG